MMFWAGTAAPSTGVPPDPRSQWLFISEWKRDSLLSDLAYAGGRVFKNEVNNLRFNRLTAPTFDILGSYT